MDEEGKNCGSQDEKNKKDPEKENAANKEKQIKILIG